MRDLGNTVIVVEHDEDTIAEADHVVDIGPGAGEHGGVVVHSGTYKQLLNNKDAITGQYLAGTRSTPIPETPRSPSLDRHRDGGAAANKWLGVTVEVHLGLLPTN